MRSNLEDNIAARLVVQELGLSGAKLVISGNVTLPVNGKVVTYIDSGAVSRIVTLGEYKKDRVIFIYNAGATNNLTVKDPVAVTLALLEPDAGAFFFCDGDTWVAFAGGGGGGGGLGDAQTSDSLAQFAPTTSAELAGVITDETGTGALVFANGPTFVAPHLGTPASGDASNLTGLPISGIAGLDSALVDFLEDPNTETLHDAVGTRRVLEQPGPTFYSLFVRANLGTATMTIATPAVGQKTAHGLQVNDPIVWSLPFNPCNNVAVTIATPGVFTSTAAHGYSANDPVVVYTSGALPTGLTPTVISYGASSTTIYYVRNPTTFTFELSLTSGGASINTTGSQSGYHKVERASSLPTGVTAGKPYYVIATGLTADAFQFSATVGGAAINTSGSQAGKMSFSTGNDANDGTAATRASAMFTIQACYDMVGLWDLNNKQVRIQMADGKYLNPEGTDHVLGIFSAYPATDPIGKSAIGRGEVVIVGNETDTSAVVLSATASAGQFPVTIVGSQEHALHLRRLSYECDTTGNWFAISIVGLQQSPVYVDHLQIRGIPIVGVYVSDGAEMWMHGLLEYLGHCWRSLSVSANNSKINYNAPGLDYFPGVLAYGEKIHNAGGGIFVTDSDSWFTVAGQIKIEGGPYTGYSYVSAAGATFDHTYGSIYLQTVPVPGTLGPHVYQGGRAILRDYDGGTTWVEHTDSLAISTQAELTIASGVITVAGSHHIVDTEGDAASDDLVTINGGVDGKLLILRPANGARTVVVKNGSGNIVCSDDCTLDDIDDTITLQYNALATSWYEIARNNAVSGGTPGGSDTQFQYNDAAAFGGANFYRESADSIAQRNGTTGQIQYIYNTYSSGGTNYERGRVGFDSGAFKIGTQKAGTGGNTDVNIESTAAIWVSCPNGFIVNTGISSWSTGVIGNTSSPFGQLYVQGVNITGKTTLTIASDAVTVTRGYHLIDTEAAAASDNLATINGGEDGKLLVIRPADSARTVVVKDGTGNIQCASDFTMDNAQDTMTLIYDSTLAVWLELSRSDNGA